ncbi:MAG: tRNA uridine-5-carboxymethylaminomethyl(34) synthesis enzyme MnmG, partial [Gammaproteobacteria bacterium]|nr:tRNA uridine-5-carboxymethylaminomethyl(34) synthesis enzyme MnmG [Gammaproteobacteria bacterium]
SRAEYRLQLREDNADLRLTEKGHELGLVDASRMRIFSNKRDCLHREMDRLKNLQVKPDEVQDVFADKFGQPLLRETSLFDLLRRPEINYQDLVGITGLESPLEDAEIEKQLEIQARYEGYIERQASAIERLEKSHGQGIPQGMDFSEVHGLSAEATEKLNQVRPETIGQASRIPGITPAAITLLLVHLGRLSEAA